MYVNEFPNNEPGRQKSVITGMAVWTLIQYGWNTYIYALPSKCK